MSTVYDFTVKDRKGNQISLNEYAGKVLLIVNTATGCGFTPHYEPLEAMYKEMKDQRYSTFPATSSPIRLPAPRTKFISSAP